MRQLVESAVETRPYRDADEREVLDLLTLALGPGPAQRRTPGYFRWKHVNNPFGRSFMRVAECDDKIIGFRSLMRWRFQAGNRTLAAVRAVDTATHPSFRGRGIFSILTLEAIEHLRSETDFIFNTPNRSSLPGYLKMGWRTAGRPPVWVRVRRPVTLLRSVGPTASRSVPAEMPDVSAETAADVLADGDEVARLLTAAGGSRSRLTTPRDLAYLRWRYAGAFFDYRALTEEQGGRVCGLAIFRIRPRNGLWENTVSELIVADGDAHTARRLMRRVAAAAPADYVACSFPAGTGPRTTYRSGFVRAPAGVTLVANPLRPDIFPDPTDMDSWGLSIGDLEVF